MENKFKKTETSDDFLQHLFDTMDNLREGRITTEEARTCAKVAKQANNVMRLHLDSGKRLQSEILKNEK